jgi:hypothetical protein
MSERDTETLRRLIAAHFDDVVEDLQSSEELLRGGLDGAEVRRVRASYTSRGSRKKTVHIIVKRLQGEAVREAEIYRALQMLPSHPAPRLLAVEEHPEGGCDLYIEAIRRTTCWPWREEARTREVLEQLAQLHEIGGLEALSTDTALYEQQLSHSALLTVETFDGLTAVPDLQPLRRSGRSALRRVVAGFGPMRHYLLHEAPLRSTFIHGDAHPGNVLTRRLQSRDVPVILDWGRSRVGSPLEDVSSWLQSLGFWDERARRRHDTLLGFYLRARGMDPRPHRRLREAYWFAAASNVLAGALRYHLLQANEQPPGSKGRQKATRCAADAIRIIRRADAAWRDYSRSKRTTEAAAAPQSEMTAP